MKNVRNPPLLAGEGAVVRGQNSSLLVERVGGEV